jgi:light-regulated signal transduction histidine kinase (bacteriophytochrome)
MLHDELDALTYAISHDLGSPVRAVQGFSRALEEDYADRLDDEGRHFLSRIQAAGDQIERMTQSLVHLARVSRSEIYPQRVDLSAMAREIRDTLHHTQPDRSVEWQIESGLMVHGDSHLLYNALEQLMRNAYQFTKDNKLARILFYQVRRDGETVFIVRDNGIGFDPEQAKNLFKPFQRLHDNGCCGDGMGLALTARIIHRHGGRIWATGKPNAGAAFFFTVPSKDATIPTRDAAGWH